MLLRCAGGVATGDVAADVDRASSRVFDPSRATRLIARIRGRALDRALIDGVDPTTSPQLAARSARLTKRSTRSGLADSLERLTGAQSERTRLWGIRPSRDAIRANMRELDTLAALLRGPFPVYAQGVAIVRTLVVDGTGPVYTDRDGGVLAAELRGAHRAMAG
jgi:hypothetical protein